MTRRHYTAAQRARVTGIAAADGVTEAERQTGIPKETIHYWLNKPEFAHLRTTAREKVIDEFWVGVQVGVQAVVEGLRGDAPLHHKADALRTLAERYALLTGGATARNEYRDVSGSLTDADLVEALRSADAITGAAGVASALEGAPED